MIANDESMKSHFSTFYLEDESGKVVVDAMKAYEHARHVPNDMRRIQKPSVQDDDNQKENSDDKAAVSRRFECVWRVWLYDVCLLVAA